MMAADYYDYFFPDEVFEEVSNAAHTGQFTIASRNAGDLAPVDLTIPMYALALVVAVVAGLLLMHGLCRKKGLKGTTALNFALLALPLGLIGARLFYVVNRLSMFQEQGMELIINLWFGGYALWGAIGGGVLAALLCAKLTKQKFSRIMDAAAAPTALVIGLARLAEYFNGEGIGMEIENKSLQFFPFAVRTVCKMSDGVVEEEWRLAVFVLEALAAFVILLVLLRTREEDGRQTKVFFLLFCAVSLVLESIRMGECLVWQVVFIKVNQLTSGLVLTGIAACCMIRRLRRADDGLTKNKAIACGVVYVLLAGVCIGMEFASKKPAWPPKWACYIIMTLSAVGIGVCAWQLIFPRKKAQIKKPCWQEGS